MSVHHDFQQKVMKQHQKAAEGISDSIHNHNMDIMNAFTNTDVEVCDYLCCIWGQTHNKDSLNPPPHLASGLSCPRLACLGQDVYLSSLLKTILKQSADSRTDFHDGGVEVSTDVLINFIMFSFAAKTFCPNSCALTGQNWFLNLFVSYHY